MIAAIPGGPGPGHFATLINGVGGSQHHFKLPGGRGADLDLWYASSGRSKTSVLEQTGRLTVHEDKRPWYQITWSTIKFRLGL